MAEVVSLAKLHPAGEVDQALGAAAIAARFAEALRRLGEHVGDAGPEAVRVRAVIQTGG